MPQALTVIAAIVIAASLLLAPLERRVVATDVVAAGALRDELPLRADRHRLLRRRRRAPPLEHLLVARGRGAVLPGLAVPAARARVGLAAGRCRRAVLAVVVAASFAVRRASSTCDPRGRRTTRPSRARWELGLGALLAVLPALRACRAQRPLARARRRSPWPPLELRRGDRRSPAPLRSCRRSARPPVIAAGSTRAAAIADAAGRYGGVGRVSYAWYVWHWPVLVFADAALGPVRLGAAPIAPARVPLAPRLGHLPLDRGRRCAARHSHVAAAAPHARRRPRGAPRSRSVIGLSLSRRVAPRRRRCAAAERGRGAGAQARRRDPALGDGLRPRPLDAVRRPRARVRGRLPGRARRGHARRRASSATAARARPSSLLGDSHAMQWFPALEPTAQRRRWRLVQLTKGGCPPPPVQILFPGTAHQDPSCDGWRECALRRIERERPALVLVRASVSYTVLDGGRRLAAARARVRSLPAACAPARWRAAAGRVASSPTRRARRRHPVVRVGRHARRCAAARSRAARPCERARHP